MLLSVLLLTLELSVVVLLLVSLAPAIESWIAFRFMLSSAVGLAALFPWPGEEDDDAKLRARELSNAS